MSLKDTLPFVASAPLNYSLPAVYALWVAVVLALYPAYRWFAEVKQRGGRAWVNYP